MIHYIIKDCPGKCNRFFSERQLKTNKNNNKINSSRIAAGAVHFLRGEIESGFHLSKTYYRRKICAKYVNNLKETEKI